MRESIVVHFHSKLYSFACDEALSELTLLNQKGKIFSGHPIAVGALEFASSDAGP